MEEIKNKEESQFHLGNALLKRIDMLLTGLEIKFTTRCYEEARQILSSIYSEIEFILTPEEHIGVRNLELQIDFIMNRIFIDQISRDGSSMRRFVYYKERAAVYPLLLQLNRLFRKLMYKHNLLMPEKKAGKI